jgi:hypothetical protein
MVKIGEKVKCDKYLGMEGVAIMDLAPCSCFTET